MTSEWLKVMLEEIERKKNEAEQARIEEDLRSRERSTEAASRPAAPPPRADG